MHAAKAISFILGTTTAYLLNRRFTFTAAPGGSGRFAGFVALYATTFAINVGMNALALAVLPGDAGPLHGGLGDRPGHRHGDQLRDAADGRVPGLTLTPREAAPLGP